MEELLVGYGYPALFVVSFLAATLLPMGSEWLLAALLIKGLDPVLSVGLATFGNTLGGLTSYAIGFWGGPLLTRRVLRMDDRARLRAEVLYGRYGSWSLLLSWLPVVGDPLCLAGGILRVGLPRFLLLVLLGKLARYLAVAWMILEGGRVLARG